MSMMEIKVPDIGDFKEVEVIELLVKPGDIVKADQSLITVESDKASMEIPSSHAGVVQELKIKLGDKVAEGTVVLIMDSREAYSSVPASSIMPEKVVVPTQKPDFKPVSVSSPAVISAPSIIQKTLISNKDFVLPHASPSVRKFSRELGVDLTRVKGSAEKGRITQEDVRHFVKATLNTLSSNAPISSVVAASESSLNILPWPSLDFSKFGETELLPLPRIKKISGPNLHRNWVMIPHITQFNEADITELEEFRKSTNAAFSKSGVKLTMLAFVIKASVAALKKFPIFNASLDDKGENLILKKYFNIGFAADTPNGLVVPVIKGVDKKGVSQIASEMGELSTHAREGKLKPADMQGACFTISSLGGIGGTGFTPIINAPEVAILGLSKSEIKPVWDGKQFVPRLKLPLSLSYDHRVIDGALGARFSVYLSEVLADMRKTLL